MRKGRENAEYQSLELFAAPFPTDLSILGVENALMVLQYSLEEYVHADCL